MKDSAKVSSSQAKMLEWKAPSLFRCSINYLSAWVVGTVYGKKANVMISSIEEFQWSVPEENQQWKKKIEAQGIWNLRSD